MIERVFRDRLFEVFSRLLMAMVFLGPFFSVYNAFATSVEISTAEELQSYFSTGGEVKLTNDITLTDNTFITADSVLDLNGHTLNMSDKTLIPSGASFTVEDNSSTRNGKITGTSSFIIQIGSSTNSGTFVLNSGTIDCQGSYGIRNYGNLTVNGGTITSSDYTVYNQGASFVMNGGSLISTDGAVVSNRLEGASFVMNGGLVKTLVNDAAIYLSQPNASFTMNGGTIEALYGEEGTTNGANAIAAFKDTEVTINGGTITSYSNTITGNGSSSGASEGTNAKFTINGGVITSLEAVGIYAPQVGGITTITGGSITGRTGIEIRSGSLIVSGGNITGFGEYSVNPNTNGVTTWGAAISVAQHTTAQAVNILITGGVFDAEVPISNANPLNHDQSTLDQITIEVKGGKFSGDDLDEVVDNIPNGYADIEDTSPSSINIVVVQVNPVGYYLSASSTGSINISGQNNTVAMDYSEVEVLSNCQAGYNLVMSSTVNDNTLYLGGDNTSEHYFSSITDNTPLNSTPNAWGYRFSDNASYTPSISDSFYAVPSVSDPITLKSFGSTATDEDINDKMRLHFGANIGSSQASGTYQLPHDESNTPGKIIYQITANPTCVDMPIVVNYNQNIDGEGGDEEDPTIANFPTYMNNTIQMVNNEPVTITLSDLMPTRDDYLFVEWNTRPDGVGTSYQPSDVITVGDDAGAGEVSGEVILYAIWTDGCAGGTICYDGNGADSGSMDEQTGERGTSVKLIPSNFNRTGYGFAGWNTKSDGTGVNYGPQQNYPIPNSGGTILYANWTQSVGTLQTWTDANSMEIGDITALTDERDGETYAVAKLDDGEVWLIENLRLDPSSANFSLLNTNHPTATFLENISSSSSTNDLCKDNNSGCIETFSYNTNNLDRSLTQSPTNNDIYSAWFSYGVYYNWHTATAGNGTYNFNGTSGVGGDGTVSGDICPAGWHLPTGNNGEFVALNNSISGFGTNDVKLRTSPNNFVRSGEFNGTVPNERGGIGRYWSSTAFDTNKAYRFGYGDGTLTPNNTWNKWSGFTVRCIYDGNRIPTSVVTVSLPEHVNSITISSQTYGNQVVTTSGATVTIASNTSYDITADFENGYTVDTWTTTGNGTLTDATSANASYAVDGSATLSLITRESVLTTYTLDYDTGVSTDTIASDSASSYNTSYIFEITSTRPYLFGYTFLGWSETSGASVIDYASGETITVTNSDPSTISSVSKTLYAVYQADTCPAENICYFGNGADAGVMANQSVSGSSVNLIPSNFSRAGYGFAGWITTENATPYGPNATIAVPDLSASGLKLYAKWIESDGDFQGWTGCSAMQVGDITALRDTRDNETYAVAKLGDGKCWMVENLRLDPGSASITALNTNNPTASFVTESNSNNTKSSTTLCSGNNSGCFDKIQYNTNNINRELTQNHDNNNNSSAWYSYGAYYNWYTATAGNGTYSSISTSGPNSDGNMGGDICPAGWHLPTGNTSGEFNYLNSAINNNINNNDANWRVYPNNFVWSGDYNNNKRTGSYGNTRIWTSTAKDNNTAYRLGLESSKVTATSNAFNKWDAFVVRCIYNNQ